MTRYRKKPVEVEAVQYHKDRVFDEPLKSHPGLAMCPNTGRDYVVTIHGERAHLEDRDWIIAEPDGKHFYPCKPDIFAATYEPVEVPA